MRFRRVALLFSLLLVAACSARSIATTVAPFHPAHTPRAAVEELIAALATADWQATESYVDETQITLLASIEGVPAAETAQMLRTGVPADVRANFWRGFSDAFVLFSQEEASEVLLGDPAEFSVEGVSFGSVPISLRHRAGLGAWITRGQGDRWRVDLFATFGPALASPLREWLAEVPDDENGRLIRAEMAAQEPSFMAALTQEPLGEISDGARFEVQLLMIEARG